MTITNILLGLILIILIVIMNQLLPKSDKVVKEPEEPTGCGQLIIISLIVIIFVVGLWLLVLYPVFFPITSPYTSTQ